MDPIIYELIEKAAQSGSAVAQFSLGVMNYAIGDPSFDESKGNLGEALIWYRRAADQGDVDSQVTLALAYAMGSACRRTLSKLTNGTILLLPA